MKSTALTRGLEAPASIDWFAPATMIALADVGTERLQQDEQHPGAAGFNWRIASDVLMEEVGEVSKARIEIHLADDTETAVAKRAELRAELVQVAAVACRWIEMIDAEVEANRRAGF